MVPRIQPIAPVPTKQPFDDSEWLFDFKYDGFRALCYLEQGRCRLISRKANVRSRVAGLGEKIAASLVVDDAILDAEVIARDETGRPQFYDLLRNARLPAYVVSRNLIPGTMIIGTKPCFPACERQANAAPSALAPAVKDAATRTG